LRPVASRIPVQPERLHDRHAVLCGVVVNDLDLGGLVLAAG
jgi:hypothetical protein